MVERDDRVIYFGSAPMQKLRITVAAAMLLFFYRKGWIGPERDSDEDHSEEG